MLQIGNADVLEAPWRRPAELLSVGYGCPRTGTLPRVVIHAFDRLAWAALGQRFLRSGLAAKPEDKIGVDAPTRLSDARCHLVQHDQQALSVFHWPARDHEGQEETRAIRNVFLFLGADPTTEWPKDCDVALDDKGFVKTGPGLAPAAVRAPNDGRLPLETSVPGVFAIGDVRAGSVKRVGSAIGEGAAVVAQVHAFTARQNVAGR